MGIIIPMNINYKIHNIKYLTIIGTTIPCTQSIMDILLQKIKK